MKPPADCTRTSAAIIAWCVTLFVAVAPAAAVAGPKKDAGKELADQAADLFKRLEYHAAAELFERSFALNPEKLVRLRNAGRAFEEAGRLEHARHLFERYLQLATAGTERTEVEQRLAALQVRLAAAPLAAPVPARAGPDGRPVPASGVEAPAAVGAVSPEAGIAAAPAATSRTPAWVVAAAGAAIAMTGVVFLVQAGSANDSVADHKAKGHYDYPGGAAKLTTDREAIAGHHSIAYAALGVGTASLAGGILWALWTQPAGSPTATLTPWLDPFAGTERPTLRGATLALRF
ncbi:MAG: tetratricopeptide repeat protein [Myxococcales bacterium]|nr:tetratricopeptide repeat protein [Myxococcales bacterium]